MHSSDIIYRQSSIYADPRLEKHKCTLNARRGKMASKAWRSEMPMSFEIRYGTKYIHTHKHPKCIKISNLPFQVVYHQFIWKIDFCQFRSCHFGLFRTLFIFLAVFIPEQLLPLLYRENNELHTFMYIAIGSLEEHDKFSARLKK